MKNKDKDLPQTTPVTPVKPHPNQNIGYDLVASPPIEIVNDRYQRMVREQERKNRQKNKR